MPLPRLAGLDTIAGSTLTLDKAVRNAVAAGTAIDAVAMALWGDGSHHVTLDQVIAAVRETGRDMDVRYKETSAAGLALSVVEC